MRIIIVSDAWHPQINGVVRTLAAVQRELQALGHTVRVIGPDEFRTAPLPTYPEIRLTLNPWRVRSDLESFGPDAVHIATEGPLGWAARRWCRGAARPFTTSFHTRFPEYVSARTGLPEALGYAWLRRFHHRAETVMAATPRLVAELERRGFGRVRVWGRGVDTSLFRQRPRERAGSGPLWLTVGRVAVEKNLEAFLGLKLPGRKMVVGDGPARDALRRRFPDVEFPGARTGEDLARTYAQADVFVFPSRTDTFGNVLLEALACGVPVAACPVPGPLDVVGDAPEVAVLDHDLGRAARAALKLDRVTCRRFAEGRGWEASARQFLANLSPSADPTCPEPAGRRGGSA